MGAVSGVGGVGVRQTKAKVFHNGRPPLGWAASGTRCSEALVLTVADVGLLDDLGCGGATHPGGAGRRGRRPPPHLGLGSTFTRQPSGGIYFQRSHFLISAFSSP